MQWLPGPVAVAVTSSPVVGVAVRELPVAEAAGPHRHPPAVTPAGPVFAVQFVTEAGTGQHSVRRVAGPFDDEQAAYRFAAEHRWACARALPARYVPRELWPPPAPN
jgi:hypothetical protein